MVLLGLLVEALLVFLLQEMKECFECLSYTALAYSWFSADVISLCKLGFRHVGAHARCEIVSLL